MRISNEAQLIISIWESVRDTIPANKREELAENIVSAAYDYGFEISDIQDICDEDQDLSNAFEIVYGDEINNEETNNIDDEY